MIVRTLLLAMFVGADLCSAESLPIWPDDFKFSASGQLSGYSCLHIYEPSDLGDGWWNNYFCWRNYRTNPSFYWTYSGGTGGRRCTKVEEGGRGWGGTFICVPYNSIYTFYWGRSGPVPGRQCSRWNEPEDGKWNDNYLCGTVNTNKCSGLSSSSKLSSSERFPVYAGSTVSVQCNIRGYTTLSVNNPVITCQSGTTYSPTATCRKDTCTSWPVTIANLTPGTGMFPIYYGTAVSVACKTGYSVTSGDTMISCVKGTQFTWSVKPSCTLGRGGRGKGGGRGARGGRDRGGGRGSRGGRGRS